MDMNNQRHKNLATAMKQKNWIENISFSDLFQEFNDNDNNINYENKIIGYVEPNVSKTLSSNTSICSKPKILNNNKKMTSKFEDDRIYCIRIKCNEIKRWVFYNADKYKYPNKDNMLDMYDIMNTAAEIAMMRIRYNIKLNYDQSLQMDNYTNNKCNHLCNRNCYPMNIIDVTLACNRVKKKINIETTLKKYSSTKHVYVCNQFKIHLCSDEKCVNSVIDYHVNKTGSKICQITGVTREFLSHFDENLKFTYYNQDAQCDNSNKRSVFSTMNNIFLMDMISRVKKSYDIIQSNGIITPKNRLSYTNKKHRKKKKSTTTMRKSSSSRSKKSKRMKIWKDTPMSIVNINSTDKPKFNGSTKEGKMKMRLRSFDYIMKHVERILKDGPIDPAKDTKFIPMLFLKRPLYNSILYSEVKYTAHLKMISGKDTIGDKIINECVRICKDLCPGKKRIKILSAVAFERIKSQIKKGEKYVESCIDSKKPIDSAVLSSISGYNPLDSSQIMTEEFPEWALLDVIETVLMLRRMCIKSPYMKFIKSPAINVTNHIIATLFLMTTGIRIGNKDIIHPHILISTPGYVVDESDLNKYGYSRKDATKGLKSIKAGLNFLSKVQPL